MWKAKLPVDDVLKRMNISIVSRCRCCLNSHSEETLQHLFLTGNCAAEVWNYYTTAAGIIDPLIQLHQAVQKWWNMKCVGKLKLVFEAMPSFICWQLWKRRNALMNGAQMSKSKVIYCINQNIHKLISSLYPWLKNVPHTWPQMVQLLEGLNPRSGSQMVQWRFLSTGWYGASRGNPGQSSAAFCIRDEIGDLIHAAARRLSNTTNIYAEVTTIHDGLQYCVNNHMLPVIMETDSLAMVNIIQGDRETPWKVSMEVQNIKEWRKRGQVQFVHVKREGNTMADCLANSVLNCTGALEVNNFQELTPTGKILLNMDKSMIPNFIFKTYKEREPD
ncbi:uncharacterized protein LOC132628625 [Lycium barbarum]|uniref:uncharacterized protein LOC132628625 n=1 Tax=Lycium barbarum TaxID=112863 RepID=UPI00293EAD76|nr:uncharacterized protein LOC132628625 [Lycium barbarum]